ncbi:hypothetical protein ZWY2020_015754 [Hordeum vulgare]|nr:hypothetical protein ZWY2020_015754 [Hordeum vulgare]
MPPRRDNVRRLPTLLLSGSQSPNRVSPPQGKQAQQTATPTPAPAPAPSSTAAGGIEEKTTPAPPNTDTVGVAAEQGGAGAELSALLNEFSADSSSAFAEARIRATFYPKFENEESDQESRTRMIEMVSQGLATMEVTLKHSGSLFMYAGNHGGAYSKNCFGNIYAAAGVFVLARLFREAWGREAPKMQSEFNDFLEKNRISISMELVTAVLGDHGQRPKDDYAVITAVTELGHGKPQFYSTPKFIEFCRKWRLPTNHVWLFSTRKSATSFFAAYDALCEEGTATPVCKVLGEIADISVRGSKDHVMVQGEILEGLVARIVSRESSVQMEVLRNFQQPSLDGSNSDLGPSSEICAANKSDLKQKNQELWPLYRGFFIDVNLFKAAELSKDSAFPENNGA